MAPQNISFWIQKETKSNFEGMNLRGAQRINSEVAFFKKSFKKCYDRIGIEHICGSGQETPL